MKIMLVYEIKLIKMSVLRARLRGANNNRLREVSIRAWSSIKVSDYSIS